MMEERGERGAGCGGRGGGRMRGSAPGRGRGLKGEVLGRPRWPGHAKVRVRRRSAVSHSAPRRVGSQWQRLGSEPVSPRASHAGLGFLIYGMRWLASVTSENIPWVHI